VAVFPHKIAVFALLISIAVVCCCSAQVLFMHSPFPASEVLRCMSFRSKLLQAMLANDVIAFHTFPHARHFLQACRRILGLPCQQGGRISISCRGGRSVMVAINHVGIEKFALNDAMMDTSAAVAASVIRSKHANKVILFGLGDSDRLSGIALQLLAFEKFLEEHSSYPKSVRWLDVASVFCGE
jgi:trehalose 6-phosphate synthase/phosphatase